MSSPIEYPLSRFLCCLLVAGYGCPGRHTSLGYIYLLAAAYPCKENTGLSVFRAQDLVLVLHIDVTERRREEIGALQNMQALMLCFT